MRQRGIFGEGVECDKVSQDKAISAPVGMTTWSCLSEDQLAHALQTDLPGAETEYSLRRQLEKYPKIIRSSIECSWGPRRCVPQS